MSDYANPAVALEPLSMFARRATSGNTAVSGASMGNGGDF